MRRLLLFQLVRQCGPSRAVVASLVDRDDDWRRFAHVLAVAVIALAGEWVVHQLEYWIEYGQRFNAVVETTPHRLYMTPLGVLFAALGMLLLATTATLLRTDAMRRSRLLNALPAWMHRLVRTTRVRVPLAGVIGTALILVQAQACVYFVQENLEAFGATGNLPGISVLTAPQHATVIPLHLLVAGVASLLLWTLATWRGTLRASADIAEALLRLTLTWTLPPSASAPADPRVLQRRLAAGRRSLRSPPLTGRSFQRTSSAYGLAGFAACGSVPATP